ncbi:hypothetical protein CBL_05560 [Carabus blaptoides fortunei]
MNPVNLQLAHETSERAEICAEDDDDGVREKSQLNVFRLSRIHALRSSSVLVPTDDELKKLSVITHEFSANGRGPIINGVILEELVYLQLRMRTAYISADPWHIYCHTNTNILRSISSRHCRRLLRLVTTRPQILKYDEVEHINTTHVLLSPHVKRSCLHHRAKTKNVLAGNETPMVLENTLKHILYVDCISEHRASEICQYRDLERSTSSAAGALVVGVVRVVLLGGETRYVGKARAFRQLRMHCGNIGNPLGASRATEDDDGAYPHIYTLCSVLCHSGSEETRDPGKLRIHHYTDVRGVNTRCLSV